MLKNVLCGLCMLVATVAASSAQAEKWAALNPNSELSSHVFWGPTKNAAEDQARAECLRLSTTCSSRPANTNELDDSFVTFCCLKPKLGCQTTAVKKIKEAEEASKKIFTDAGYSVCSMRQVLSAETGESQF
jgi:hypothetical protein